MIQLRVRVVGALPSTRVFIEHGDGAAVQELVGRVGLVIHTDEALEFLFDRLQPGNYRVSIDRKTWLPVELGASPTEQMIEIFGTS